MKSQFTSVLALIALLVSAWCALSIHRLDQDIERFVRSNSVTPSPQVSAHDVLEDRIQKLESATPDVGQIMLGLQLRFAKLHFAAEARNWDLARFEREEIIEDLSTVATIKPMDNGVNLAGIIGAFTNSTDGPLASMKDAIDVSDRALFRKAYLDSMALCNACHQSTGRPFICITVPTNPPVFNQSWVMPAVSQANSTIRDK